MDLVLAFLFTPAVYIPVAGASFFLFLTTRYLLKVKKEYGGINLKMAMMLSLFPGINFVFLIFNSLLFGMRATKFRVVKVKSYKPRVSKKKHGYSLGRS